MSQRVYRVLSVSVERNVRSVEMRRIHLSAIEGEAFGTHSVEPPAMPADPDGHLSELVTVEEARRFQPGEIFSLTFRERE